MNNWYFYSIAALVLLGTQRFLYKVAAERNCRSALTTAVFMGTVTLLSGTVFFASGESVGNLRTLILLALVNSAAFALATIGNMEALRHLPAGVTFPLTRLSLVVVLVVSLVCFHERLVATQWLGILAGLAVVAVLAGEAGQHGYPRGNPRRGFGFVALCVVCGAIASVSSKLAAVSTSKSGFMALSYLLATLFALAIEKRWGGPKAGDRPGAAVRIGVLMGVLNFFGFYAFLTALATGPLSVIALITGMHFVIAIGLSVLLYREKLTLRRGIGIGLTLLAILFLKQ
jgi:bacterial/archaeal transporter family protein